MAACPPVNNLRNCKGQGIAYLQSYLPPKEFEYGKPGPSNMEGKFIIYYLVISISNSKGCPQKKVPMKILIDQSALGHVPTFPDSHLPDHKNSTRSAGKVGTRRKMTGRPRFERKLFWDTL